MNVFLQLNTCALLGASHLCSQSSKDSFMERKDKTMKNMKKFSAIVLAIVMVLMYAVPVGVFAEDAATSDNTTSTVTTAASKGSGSFSITMTGAEDGHKFTAYRIFDGSVNTDGKLGDISWATGVNTEGIAAALQTAGLATTVEGKTLDLSKAEDVATALAAQSDDSETMKKVADVFYARKGTKTGEVSAKTGDNYVISDQVAGYYLVTDEYTTGHPAEGDATLSRNILAVVGDVTAAVKNDKPTVEKKILTPTAVDANKAGIGDTVAFQITGEVPNYAGYDKYFYVINDTLSSGLTFDGAQNVVVKVGDATLKSGTDYVVLTSSTTPAASSGHTFEVAFKNIKGYTVGTAITVTYSATVNSNAAIGTPGNKNETDVTYSNNPNDSSDGNPSENPKPDSDTPTGTSAKDTTVTYVAELDLTKYKDAVNSANLLPGATFTLTGNSTVVKGKGSDIFVEDANGAYWKLTDNTYTTTAPHGDIKDTNGKVKVESNESSYASTSTKYSLQHVTEYESGTEAIFMQGTSGQDGKITFKGLGAGTYTLTEVVTPSGYNTADPITFTIEITVPGTITTGSEAATYSVTNITPEGTTIGLNGNDAKTGIYETNVIDKSGTALPSTGGIGTTIFYILGTILVLGAGVLLVTRRRMRSSEE